MANILYGNPANLYGNTNNLYGVPGTTWTGVRWIIEVDWDGDSIYNGDNEARYCVDLETERGFNELYDVDSSGYYSGLAPVDNGIATLTLDNETKRFSAWNSSGTLYGKLYPGKNVRIKMREDYTGTDRAVFTGIIDDLQENRTGRTVMLVCKDGVDILKGADASVAFTPPILPYVTSTSVITNVEGFIQSILTSIGWAWSYDVSKFPTSVYPLYYLICNQRAFTEFKEIAKANRGGDGIFYLNAAGDVVFDMLQDFGLTPTTYTASIFDKEVEISQPWKNVIKSIKAKVYRWVAKADDTVWDYGQPPLMVPANSSLTVFANYTYNSTETLMMVDANDPVSTTDYVANDASDGSGADLTSSVSISLTNLGTAGRLVVTNNSGSDAYFTTLKLSGTPYVITESYNTTPTEKNGIYNYGNKTMVAGSKWFQIENNDPFLFASFAFSYTGYADFTKTVTVKLRARSQQFLHEINDLIAFNISDPDLREYVVGFTPYYGVYANRFRIMKIKHKWLNENGQDVQTTWTLRHILFY